MSAYYNEHDPEKAAWIRELIKRGVVAPGDVDERSITDVRADDLRGYKQCHFFAGIAVWSYSLRLAGWPDDRECWTGSCPCPSFSSAGKGEGFDDARHLWPNWYPLIRECRPAIVFGEQVAAAIRHGWWDLVSTDLESASYAAAAAVLTSAGVGGPDIRERLYWVADAENGDRGSGERGKETGIGENGIGRRGSASGGEIDGLAHSYSDGRYQGRRSISATGDDGTLGNHVIVAEHFAADALKGHWRTADWLLCTDGRWRPVEAGTFPLDSSSAGRLGRLRGYGDCINAEVAKAFIEAVMDALCTDFHSADHSPTAFAPTHDSFLLRD